ncbi:phage integrase central domain-containing protein [Pseudochelatococcus sp. B33]
MWTEKTHAYDVLRSLERDVFPKLGDRYIASVTAPAVLDVLREIEDRPAIETAKRVRQRMSAVFVYAMALRPGTLITTAWGATATSLSKISAARFLSSRSPHGSRPAFLVSRRGASAAPRRAGSEIFSTPSRGTRALTACRQCATHRRQAGHSARFPIRNWGFGIRHRQPGAEQFGRGPHVQPSC